MEGLAELIVLSWSSIAMLLALILAGLCSLTYILRRFQRKPLPPGPRGLPLIGHLHLLGELPHRTLQKLSQKYGPIMQLRMGLVPTIIVSSPEAAELFLKTHDLNFASRPNIQAAIHLEYGRRGMAFAEYGPYWRNLRKLSTIHLLSMAKIESFMPLRKEMISEFVRDLKKAGEHREAVNISAQVAKAIEKITYTMVFGKGWEGINLKPSVEEALVLTGGMNLADYIPFLKAFDLQGLRRRLKKVSKAMDAVLDKMFDEHEKTLHLQKTHRDFIDMMLSIEKTNSAADQNLDRTSMKAVTFDMLVAALDTSSTTLEWALTELVKNPNVMQRLQEELKNVVGMDSMVEEQDLAKLPYLDMVVKETMRIHSVAPLLVPHESINDMTVQGFFIPKKSRVMVNAWAIGHDPNVWSSNVEDFYPERFMNSDIDVRGRHLQLIPFGSGRRSCPGMELGLRTINIILAQLVHCFDLELPNGMSPTDVDMEETFGLTIPRKNPLLVIPNYRLQVNNLLSVGPVLITDL